MEFRGKLCKDGAEAVLLLPLRRVRMTELAMAKLRAAAVELGCWPATTDDEHLDKLRADNERFELMNAHDPQGLKWSKMGSRRA